jgi:RNA polymerase sigma factor (sigma-70 family)
VDERQTTDRELIGACRVGDARAWERLLEAYERLVFSIPLSYGLSREDAADITQATFTALLQSIDSLREDSRLGAWLATVARRQTWRLLQHRRHESGQPIEDLEERVALAGGIDSAERWALVEWLHAGLAKLNQRCRSLLLALYFDTREPSYAELAARIGIPLGSVGPTRARCLERLKQLLGDVP